MLGAADHGPVGRAVVHPGKPQQRGRGLHHSGLYVGDVEFPRGNRVTQRRSPLLAERHLKIATRLHGSHRVAQASDEVGDDEAIPTPVSPQCLGEQGVVLAAPVAV